jgi:hypothetical protein
MRAAAAHFLVAVLVWSLTPGLNELAENIWHLAVSGHSAHAIEQGEDHAPEGDEHGCSGTFHLCGCHHSPPTELAGRPVDSIPAPSARLMGLATTPSIEPFLAGLLRPPRV